MPSLTQSLRRGRGLPTFAALTLGFMVLVILWGAVVRATGSGAGCGNHWPLCNGDFVPHHPRLATLIEFTHRSMSGVCTFLVAALLAWTFAARPKGHRARKAAVVSAVLLLTEAFLGAVLVKGGYVEGNTSDARVLMQCVHFTNTMLLLAALSLTWAWLRSSDSVLRPPVVQGSSHPSRGLAWLTLAFTVASGATGSVAALADTLFPAPSLRVALLQDFSSASPLLVRMRWMHPATVLLAAVSAFFLFRHESTRPARAVLLLLFVQFLLGPLDVFLLAPVWLQVLHLLGADLFWIALAIAAAGVLAPAGEAAVSESILVNRHTLPV